MRYLLIPVLLIGLLLTSATHAAAPDVSNVRASQREGTKLVDIYYDLTNDPGEPSNIHIEVSVDGGTTWRLRGTAITGDVGSGVAAGTNRLAIWDAGTDFDGHFADNCKARVTAYDEAYPEPPMGMVYIPPGTFQMGDNLDAISDAPVTYVELSAYFIDRTEVTSDAYQTIRAWANTNGYDLPALTSLGAGFPQGYVSWFTAVKFANAKSEYENLHPCYYTDSSHSVIYRSGEVDLEVTSVKWNADGYRLPTEAEWEKASRGSFTGKRFPWGTDSIDHSYANYTSTLYDPFEGDSNATYGESLHPDVTSSDPYTLPVSYFPANGYGLYNMSGNVWEWCWERYSSSSYGISIKDPVEWGSTYYDHRIVRGGAAKTRASELRCAYREASSPDSLYSDYSDMKDIGFRLVRSAP